MVECHVACRGAGYKIVLYCTFMEKKNLFEKVMEFAEKGKGRRLLNTLNKRDSVLESFELDEVLKMYCEVGLQREVETLKSRRGILRDDQYNALAEEIRDNCCSQRYDAFAASLRNLLSSGMRMNPTKMGVEAQV